MLHQNGANDATSTTLVGTVSIFTRRRYQGRWAGLYGVDVMHGDRQEDYDWFLAAEFGVMDDHGNLTRVEVLQ